MQSQSSIPAGRIDYARKQLTHYMISQAAHAAKILGFSYDPTENAPSSYKALRVYWSESQRKRVPLPVFSGGCESTIYTSAEGNYAFRFLHDVAHCILEADFSNEGEAKAIKWLGDKLSAKFGKDSLEYKLYMADTMGQVAYYAIHKRFVTDQLAYVLTLLETY